MLMHSACHGVGLRNIFIMEYGVHVPVPAVGNTIMGPCRHFRPQRRRPWVQAQVDDDKGPDPAVIGALGLMSGLLAVQPAHGLTRSWHPRRHHRKLEENWFIKPYTEQVQRASENTEQHSGSI